MLLEKNQKFWLLFIDGNRTRVDEGEVQVVKQKSKMDQTLMTF